MALKVGKANLDKLAETEAELQAGDRRFWTPEVGKNMIRIMPPPDEDHDQIFAKSGSHYGIGPDEKVFPCPKIGGARAHCWLCDEADRLAKSKDEDDQADAKELRATRKFLVTVVDLNKPKEGFKVWPVGVKLFREILTYVSDPDYGDISDLEEGYDFTVTRKGTGINTDYGIRAAKKPTNFYVDFAKEFPDDAYDDLPILEDFLTYETDAAMEAAYNGVSSATGRAKGKKGEDDEDEEDEKPARGRGSPTFPDEEDEDEKPARGKKDEEEDEEEEKPARTSGRARGAATGSRLRRGLRT